MEESSRPVRWLDLKSGRWTTLALMGASSLHDTDRGALILSTDSDTLTVTAAVGTEFETVARLTSLPNTFVTDLRALRYTFAGTERILLGGLGQFERSDGGWQRLPSPIPTSGEPSWITPSPDGAHLCIVGADGSAWLVDGSAAIALDLSRHHCSFSPDGSLAAFTGVPGRNNLHLADLHGASVADFDYLYLQQNRGDFAYGTNGPQLVRLDWHSLEVEALPSPTWCPADRKGGLDTGLFHYAHLVGNDAVVENACPCTDCRYSGVYLLRADGSVEPLLSPREWQILQIVPVADDLEASATDREGAQPSALPGHALLAIDPQQDPYKVEVPEQCVERGDEYVSTVRICVDATGSVSGVSVLEDSLPILDTQLPYIITRWEYSPYLLEGGPTPFCYSLRYRVR